MNYRQIGIRAIRVDPARSAVNRELPIPGGSLDLQIHIAAYGIGSGSGLYPGITIKNRGLAIIRGKQTINWTPATSLSAGVYLYKITGKEIRNSGKIIKDKK